MKNRKWRKITIFFTKKVFFFFFWNDLIKTTQFLNKLRRHLHSTVSRNKMTQIKVLYNFRESQSKLLDFKEQNQNDHIAIYN